MAALVFYVRVDLYLTLMMFIMDKGNVSNINTPIIWLLCKNPLVTKLTKNWTLRNKKLLGITIYIIIFILSTSITI